MTPRATIRLQFNSTFTLDDAAAIVPYLKALHITHIYTSPIFAAKRGSSHGYDIVDPTRINPEIGGMPAFERLASCLRGHDMGIIVDFVPNHMAASHENPWWYDLLEHGRVSRFARYFDVNWRPADAQLHNRVLLPVLGADLSSCIAAGEIKLAYDDDRRRFQLRYYEHLLPLAPASYPLVLRALGGAFAELAQQWPSFAEVGVAGFARQCHLIADLRSEYRADFDENLVSINAAVPQHPELLVNILFRQHYRLAPWTDAAEHINWRRFFDISDLVALRMDRGEVFAATHELLTELFRQGLIDGVRLDHVDGLADPEAYCRRLRRTLKRAAGERVDGAREPLVVVEKILDSDETLPTVWSVDGTTGYDFMSEVAGILHDVSGEAPLTHLWAEASGDQDHFSTIAAATRREILHRLFPRQLKDLADQFIAALQKRPTLTAQESMRRSLTMLLAAFTRYRLYGDNQGLSSKDEAVLSAYRRQAAADASSEDRQTLEKIERLLCRRDRGDLRAIETRCRFQQLSATLAAKAVEDTAFYRYGRLLSRNEVGSDPGAFCLPLDKFHAANQRRQKLFPRGFLATATHDHKRGEDLRCRLAVLSEDAAHWRERVHQWLRLHESAYPTVPAATKVMIYQMAIGAWPLDLRTDDPMVMTAFSGRLSVWLQKSLREAKQQTSWDRPDADFEAVCTDFLLSLLDSDRTAYFLMEAETYLQRISATAALNSLTQLTLRCTCPGIPDLYQGCDLWDFSLVDPDNRRQVDFAHRARSLTDEASFADLLIDWRNGRLKQHLLRVLLGLRSAAPDLFGLGRYLPLATSGPAANSLVAFVRQQGGESLIVIAPRLVFPAMKNAARPLVPAAYWTDTHVHVPTAIPNGAFIDQLSGKVYSFNRNVIAVAELLEQFPLCLLLQKAGGLASA